MKNKHATIYDVAELAGVSITTVSRLMNNPQQVSPSSREKILAAMDSLRFIPRADAMARARKDFHRIGVLTPFSTAPSFVQRQRGIASALNKGDYELITYSVESLEHLTGFLSMLPVSHRIDGLIILSLPITEKEIGRFNKNNIPVVTVETSHPLASSVEINNEWGGHLAADYLLSCGYRRPAFIGEGGQPAYSLHATDQRFNGFKKRLSEKGYDLPKEFSCFHKYDIKYTLACAEELLSKPNRPDAIFAASDYQAVGVIKACRNLNLSIPEDLGLLGFDNIDLADYMEITTINQSLDESGRTAAELLIEKLKNPTRTTRNIMLNLNIIERKTTKVAKK